MYPTLLEIGPLKLHMYGLMIAIGFLTALYLVQRDVQRGGYDPKIISEMGFIALLAGLAGTRLAHILLYPSDYSWSDPIGWVAIWRGGLVFQGAIPVGFAYAWFGLKQRGLPFWVFADFVLPYLPLAQAFGRVGCFFKGCCFGMRCDALPWAIRFPKDSPAFIAHALRYPELSYQTDSWSFPVHPTQLYSAVGLFMIVGTLLLVRKYWKLFDGICLPMYFILYGVMRFIVEFFRGDGNPRNLGWDILSNQQMFCLLFIAIGVVVFVFRYRQRGAPSSRNGGPPPKPH